MNNLISALLLAVIQGITEWIPISSKGHLIVFKEIFGYEYGLIFDVALHFGTLMAVFVYFGRDITDIMQDLLKGRWQSENGKLGIALIIATIPAVITGFFVKNLDIFANLFITSIGFGITGLFLIIASLDLNKKNKELSYLDSFYIGIAQIFSLFPGISRSGSTIGAGILLGLNEKTAVKFSFLMSIPVVFGANILVIGDNPIPKEFVWATLVSFIVGIIVLHLLYNYILTSKKNLRWFGAYALLLALVVMIWILVQ